MLWIGTSHIDHKISPMWMSNIISNQRSLCICLIYWDNSFFFVFLISKVLSSSVSKIMYQYGSDDMNGTAKFLGICDRLFDCLNVRSTKEGHMQRKPDLLPYVDMEDPRFQVSLYTWNKFGVHPIHCDWIFELIGNTEA